MSDLMSMSGAAYDTQSLNKLKRDVSLDPQAHIKEVAKQFEGVFVQMMLKSMREALPQDGMLSNDQTRLYTSLYDQQIAQEIGKRGLGLLEEWLLGSVTKHILAQSNGDVLVTDRGFD